MSKNIEIGGDATNSQIVSGDQISINIGNTSESKKEVPSLLPYLPNRDQQEFELKEPAELLKQGTPHPLVWIIHGDEFQSHDTFVQRLQEYSLPRLLGLEENQKFEECQLTWPYTLDKLDRLNERLLFSLSNQMHKFSSESLPKTHEEINELFRESPLIIVRTSLFTCDWSKHKFETLNKLLEFWQNWPPLNYEQKLIICICIKYEKKRLKPSRKSSFVEVLKYLINWYNCRKINHQISRQLAELKESEFQRFNRLSCTILSELKDISKREVEEWINREEIKDYVGKGRTEKLRKEVRDIFENLETIPMDDLADKLESLLKKVTKIY